VGEDESVLVIMGDQFFYRTDGGSNAADLIHLAEESGTSAALFGNPVPEEDVSHFGIIEKDEQGHFVQIVEKPSREEAPSNLNNSSFYLFDKAIFELARSLPVNPKRGEYEITDAINAYVNSGKRLVVGTATGTYMECGSVEGWFAANEILIRGQ
jgi:dTDP-glucose pyrophosphorylase